MRFIIIFTLIISAQSFARDRVIYGEDNRKEIHQVDSYWQKKADSTVALFFSSDVEDLKNGRYKLKGDNYGSSQNLCMDEPYREQMSGAFCSGSLVAPNIIMTAGHCVRTDSGCGRTKFIFGFGYKVIGQDLSTVPALEVYSCKKLIVSKLENAGADFALVELDRAVIGHDALEVRREGEITVGQTLTVIGHPAGIPTKVADGARVRSLEKGFFVANLDTYGGNSGSAVINDQTGLVEGILVRGEKDFVFSGGCYKSNVCADDSCSGEDVTNVAEVVKYLN